MVLVAIRKLKVMAVTMDNGSHAIRAAVSYHGDLESVTDSERRGLRPIGAAVRDVAAWTGALLADLIARPSVHIFQGVRSAGPDSPTIPHAVSAGRHVVFIESVTWPPGRYTVEAADRVYCDDVYIGQSIGPLITAVCRWREMLPPGHRVSALVAVHPIGAGPVVLPGVESCDLIWALPHRVVRDLCDLLPVGQRDASDAVITALIAACRIADPGLVSN
jgi:hypothetical protein